MNYHNIVEVKATGTVDIGPSILLVELLTWVSWFRGSIPCPAFSMYLYVHSPFPVTCVAVTNPWNKYRSVEHETLNIGVVGKWPALLADVIENAFLDLNSRQENIFLSVCNSWIFHHKHFFHKIREEHDLMNNYFLIAFSKQQIRHNVVDISKHDNLFETHHLKILTDSCSDLTRTAPSVRVKGHFLCLKIWLCFDCESTCHTPRYISNSKI